MFDATIIIPAYNAEKWICGAIESALGQNGVDVEVVVVDDGSSDRTLDLIRRFEPQIRWESSPNLGAPSARNRGLALATTPWVSFLDADDYLRPQKIKDQLSQLSTASDIDVIYGPVTIEWHSKNGVRTQVHQTSMPDDPWASLALWELPQTGSPLFRRQALIDIGGWKEDQPCCQEHDLYLRLLMAGKMFHHSGTNGAVYRRFETGTLSTSNIARVWRERLKIEARLERHLNERDMITPLRQWAINQARFEIARSAWSQERHIALRAHQAITQSGAAFAPRGNAGPVAYRALYRVFGFSFAQKVAEATRSLRNVLA
ncbi:MAG: glycosyltransferase [Erythrobacter sp.]|jgi:glycosyltransferase involved in cell wall biosynthesis|nr:glycosyltransferase [Erythrobacter sp.]